MRCHDADNSGGAIHDEKAIELAWARVRAFFGLHLSADPRVQAIPGGIKTTRMSRLENPKGEL